MVNVHGHAPMTLFTDDDVYWGTALACAEMLRSGVTTSCEMYSFEDGMVDAAVEAGTRCVITPGVMEVPGWPHFESWRHRLDDVLDFHARHHGESERIEVGIAAHSAYALPLEGLEAVAAVARERDALVHIHVAETRAEGLPSKSNTARPFRRCSPRSASWTPGSFPRTTSG
jgi:5-methylthioadenosine/S-adenosylhomocysteine deaminase